MNNNPSKYLPQITYYYEGYLYPFIGNAGLAELINMRNEKIHSDTFSYYNKDARNTYFEHLQCIEQCIKILMSNPTPEVAINALEKKRKDKIESEKIRVEKMEEFFKKMGLNNNAGNDYQVKTPKD